MNGQKSETNSKSPKAHWTSTETVSLRPLADSPQRSPSNKNIGSNTDSVSHNNIHRSFHRQRFIVNRQQCVQFQRCCRHPQFAHCQWALQPCMWCPAKRRLLEETRQAASDVSHAEKKCNKLKAGSNRMDWRLFFITQMNKWQVTRGYLYWLSNNDDTKRTPAIKWTPCQRQQ